MENKIILPKTQEQIDKLKEQPTTTERINALESALSDIAMMIVGVEDNG